MNRSFRGRLFIHFLQFSIIPTLLMAAFGYYVTLQVGRTAMTSENKQLNNIKDYYSNLIFQRLKAEAQVIRSGKINDNVPDLIVIEITDNRNTILRTADRVSPTALNTLIDQAKIHDRGFVDVSGQICQFISENSNDGKRIVVGWLHGSDYNKIISSLESQQEILSARRELWPTYSVFLGIVFIALTILTAIGSYLLSARLSRQISHPLVALSQATQEMTEGKLKQSVTSAGDKEMRVLIENFNRMSAQLDNLTEKLIQTERVAAWRQVARRFAHELKNPLQPILISLYRIQQYVIETGQQDKFNEPLQAVSEEVKHLQILAQRFSQLAKLPEPHIEKIDLLPLIKSVADLHKDNQKAISIELFLPANPVTVQADESFLREALHNLLQNACDATPDNGSIELAIKPTQNHVEIMVRDFGTGMDNDTLASSRLPYFTTKEKGTGLGLAIVERSMIEMGGQLLIESIRGKGTTATLVVTV
jgi:nitrogen fixation/metabolism regulation signal transduction histidine kinase